MLELMIWQGQLRILGSHIAQTAARSYALESGQ